MYREGVHELALHNNCCVYRMGGGGGEIDECILAGIWIGFCSSRGRQPRATTSSCLPLGV